MFFFCYLESRLVVSWFTISIADSPSLVCMTNPNDGCVFLSGADWLVTSGAGCCSRWWVISWYPHDIPSWLLVIPMDWWLISVISHGLTKEQSLQLNAVVSSSSMGALIKLWWCHADSKAGFMVIRFMFRWNPVFLARQEMVPDGEPASSKGTCWNLFHAFGYSFAIWRE